MSDLTYSNNRINGTKSSVPAPIRIPLGENFLVIFADFAPDVFDGTIPPECYVHIENKDGVILQNIALIRPCFYFLENKGWVTDPAFVDVLLWTDSDYEDFTDHHTIAVIEEEFTW